MSTPPESLVAKIHRLMADGLSDEEIVSTLMEQGLSRPTAERFLARAWETPVASATSSPPPVPGSPPDGASTSPPSEDAPILDLFVGMGLLLVGVYLLGSGAQLRGKIMIGLLFGGALAYGRAMWRCLWHVRPLPWKAMSVTSLPVVVAVVWGVGLAGPRSGPSRNDSANFAVTEAALAAQRAADAKRAVADAARSAATQVTHDKHVATLLKTRNSMFQCEAAIALGRSRLQQYVPVLEDAMRNDPEDSVKICAAGGLVEMGESSKMISVYDEWARSSNTELARSAVGGFGDIGPSAAAYALPYLSQWLRGDEWSRTVAVDTLSKLGPAARPLLEQASRDPVSHIRARALHALDPSNAQLQPASQP